jgi:hypothetical protein
MDKDTMLSQQWHSVPRPMYGWAITIEKILIGINLPRLDGAVINIFSDYSGQHKRSKYETITALYFDLDASSAWEIKRREIRDKWLPDGRRMSFKSLSDRYKQKALIPFLEAANDVVGILITLIINKSIRDLCVGDSDFDEAKSSLALHQEWTLVDLENTLRVAHLIGLLIGGLSKPGQNIYWISDEDSLFANIKRTQDLSIILGKITGFYVPYKLGELGMGTTSIDPGDRYEEDTAAIADLTAGGICEAVNTIANQAGGKIPRSLAFPFEGSFSHKTDIISSWVWQSYGKLRKVVILFEKRGTGYSVSKWDMQI